MLLFSHDELLPIYNRMRDHIESGLPTLANDVYRVPIDNYTSEERWKLEVDEIFRKRPLPLAFSRELPEPGSYRALTVGDVPVLIVRTGTGEARAYINACRHRGMPLVEDGSGRARRFTCGYHAWTYAADDGRLLAIPDSSSFGDVDKSCRGLTSLPVEERSGLIWVALTPGVALHLDTWLGEMAPNIEKLGLDQFEVFASNVLDGPNWKVVMEGYLETYHFSALHTDSFNALIFGNMSLIDLFDSHLRLCVAMRGISEQPRSAVSDTLEHVQHSFWLFPSFQISFSVRPPGQDAATMALVSQVFPGSSPDKSTTIQRIITNSAIRGTEYEETARAFAESAFNVVRTEDYEATKRIQRTLMSGANEDFLVGRNEIGIQHFHRALGRHLGVDTGGPLGHSVR